MGNRKTEEEVEVKQILIYPVLLIPVVLFAITNMQDLDQEQSVVVFPDLYHHVEDHLHVDQVVHVHQHASVHQHHSLAVICQEYDKTELMIQPYMKKIIGPRNHQYVLRYE